MTFCRGCVLVALVALVLGLFGPAGVALAQDEMPDFPAEFEQDATAAAGMGCACMVVGLLISLASIALWVFICVWVYRDANARGMDNATLWVVITILTGLLGLIIYLIVRPAKPGE